ncbi:MAG: glycine cleavage system aminomethyltransferase GcvT [Thermoanaerobaculales bacterium]|jgi:aminomethyltransferase|nr:glycine cleavage system aminomethyltransferase GcvT [Thermoanaerobaculales bacterium]
MSNSQHGRRTALYDEHVAAGGRMVEFAGFELPVQYSSLGEEHEAVRQRAGVFDVSHMGEIVVGGPGAMELVQLVSCNDHGKLAVGRAQYTGLMYPEGTFVDDMLVHRMAEDEFLLVVNAANREKDVAYLEGVARGRAGVEVVDRSEDWAQLAVQGPLAQEILQALTPQSLGEIKYYRFVRGEVAGVSGIIARTGYTGEDGFEVYVGPQAAPAVWRAILETGRPAGLRPAGLGARDTLRFEAGMCLYGNDIDAATTPLEAGLEWIVKLDKGDFIGRDVLESQAEAGVERRLCGLEMVERGIARHGYPVRLAADDSEPAGVVTSGTQSPTLGKALAMAYLPVDAAAIGREVFVEVRSRTVRARVVALPFYSRKRKSP